MHKHKRVLTSAIALLLCFLTLFSSAFAYTQQQATSGYPQPPTYKGGNNSGNSHTSYTDPVIVGYRFTCWRSEDFKIAMEKGLIKSPADRQKYLKSHNEEGKKLGHSINIMCNAVDSNGNRRTDYANGYSQTGLKMPHMLTNGEQNDFLDKLSLAHSEQKSDATQPNKITHSTATGLMLMDYAGSNNGNFTDTSESSYFEFYQPVYRSIDEDVEAQRDKQLSSAFKTAISPLNPLTVYSGYYTRDQWNNVYLNTSPENDGEAQNLHTYIYGFQSDSQMGTSLKGYDRSEGVTTISDIDYDGKDVLPFNQNPANVIQSGNPNTWTNKNATLIATLCGLDVAYGEDACDITNSEFGVYDYIIVEPIMMYYYYYTRYYVTASDTAILQAQSMRDTAGNSRDVWTSIYYGGYKLFDVCGKFPAVYGTYVYTEEPYFGVDGVFNATTQRGYPVNAFQTSRDGLDLSSIASDSNNKSGNADRKGQDSRGWNTYAFVFTTKSGYTLFGGGDNKMNRAVDRTSQIRIRDGQNSFFLAPYIAVESMIGAGVFMSGQNVDSASSVPNYEIIYHSNPNSGGANNQKPIKQIVQYEASSLKLWDYQTALVANGLQPVGKIPTSYWTFTKGNGYGIADNTLNNISKVYPNTAKENGKISVTTTLNGWGNIDKFFNTYGYYVPETNTMEVHLYAAWNTKSLVTTLDRTYDSAVAQTLQAASLQDPSGSMWFKDNNYLPKSISVVATNKGGFDVKDVIQLQKDSSTGYQWFQKSGDTGNLDNTSYDYYVVYSFSKDGITDSDANAIKNAFNKQNQNDLLIYRNNGVPVKWTSNVNLFYFDFYSFKVDAPNCSIVATVANYPDADMKVQKQGANGTLDLKLVRGSTVSYTVTPDFDKGYYFDPNIDFSEYLSWENASGVNPHILKKPLPATSTYTEKQNGRLDIKNIRVCNSCSFSWDTTATKCSGMSCTDTKCAQYGCAGTSYSADEKNIRVYYAGSTTVKECASCGHQNASSATKCASCSKTHLHTKNVANQREVLGKQHHKYTVQTGTAIRVIPRVNGTPIEPFENYFVDIISAVSGQRYIYSTTPMSGTVEIPASAKGVVEHAIAGTGEFHVLVSATDQSGRDHMQNITTVNTSLATNGVITVYVDYYTASMSIQTTSGGNHSGISGSMYYTPLNVSDINQAISQVYTDHTHNDSKSCTLCADTNFAYAESVGLGACGQFPGLQLNIVRDSNEDWYFRSVKRAIGGSVTTTNGPVAQATFETAGATSYTQTFKVNNEYNVEYLAEPYHYIAFYLDGEQVNPSTLGVNSLANHTAVTDINGFTVYRGALNTSISNVSSIINASTKAHVNSTQDKITATYNKDAVTTTSLHYYTVTTDADTGYSATTITSGSNASVGNKAYILSSTNNYDMYVSCATGHPKEIDESIENTRTYKASATLGTGSYADTSVSGKITAYNTKVTKQTIFTGGLSTNISKVNAPSTLYWRSNLPRYELKFIFRINSVPYDSLPSTINNVISLDGNNPLTFSTDANGNVVATGTAVASTGDGYSLYLGGVDTGMKYKVTSNTASNVYEIDFYTLRVAAGTGINSVHINATDVGKGWNGTLPYYRDGKRFASTLAVWPKSMTSATEKIYLDARAEGEYVSGDTILTSPGGYSFMRWDTKRPTSNISITYNNGSATSTTTREAYVIASKMNHATVVQAEATTNGTPIDIPTYPEHNSIYYGVKVRTFLDGRLTTPWNNMSTDITLSANNIYHAPIQNGVAPWATVLDLVAADGKTAIADPYKGKSASALLAPSREFAENPEINTEYFYSGSNAYIANQYTYIDAFYYTQTMQTQVNGINTPPWDVGANKEVLYRQFYKGTKVNTTQLVSVNDAGAFQTVMLKGMEIKVGGLPVAKASASASDYKTLYENFAITGNHAFLIPYYTVDMKAVCERTDLDITCSHLTLTFNGTSLKTSVQDGTPALVMEGSYSISTTDSATTHADNCTEHSFFGWDLQANEVYILEYVDSGDGKNPYPVLTYTGESRPSTSTIATKANSSTSVYVNDETHLVARYGGGQSYTLTLKSEVYDETGKLLTNVNPIDMYRGNDTGAKYHTANGESNKYPANDRVHVSANLQPQTVYYPKDISVTFYLTCPHCAHRFAYDSSVTKCPSTSCNKPLGLQNATSADVSEIYYATAENYTTVKEVVSTAERMDAESRAKHLAANHVVEMKRTAAGTYVGTIPYAETAYHLYVNGERQAETYDVLNTKKKEFVWGKPTNSNIVWEGTTGINDTTATTTPYSDFDVTMNQNRTYTVYAHQEITGEQSGNKSIEFVCATIYTSTDYANILPYNKTHVYINNVKTPLASADGHTFFVAKGSTLSITAQKDEADNAYYEIFNSVINGKKTFLLSYNTVTVTGTPNIYAEIDGAESQKETWLANFAIDNQAFQSANTTYTVTASGGLTTSSRFDSVNTDVTIKTSAGRNLQLVAVEPKLRENQELIGTFSGLAKTRYLYVLENTAANRLLLPDGVLSQHESCVEKYIIGLSDKPLDVNTEANKNVAINMAAGVEYNVIIDWSNNNCQIVNVVAEAGTMFSAAGVKGDYTFRNLPNGRYEIYMNNIPLITNGDDIRSATGAVSTDGTHIITVQSTGFSAGTSSIGFGQWDIDNTTGKAETTKATANPVSNTYNLNKVVANQLLTGTINYVVRDTESSTGHNATSNGTLQLPDILDYKVQVYLDDKLNSTFPKPVKVGVETLETIDIINGESGVIPGVRMPQVHAVANAHDTAYSLVYKSDGSCPAITYDAATRTFKVYYYSVTYGVDPENGTLGELLASGLCGSENMGGSTPVAKGSTVTVNEATLTVGDHNRVAATKQVAGYQVTFTGWTKNESDAIPTTITAPTHFIAHFVPGGGTEYTVTLYNKTANFTGYLLNQTNDNRVSYKRYMLEKTTMTGGKKSSIIGNAPESIADIYLYGDKSTMTAIPTGPSILNTQSDTVNITLNLTGYTSELAHKVAIKNVTTGTTYTDQVAANEKVAQFNNIPSGYYQLYVDDIKYVTPFDYATHDDSCKVTSTTNVVHTPHYQTEMGAGGLIYVAPIYQVRYSSVSHWSQVRYDRVSGKYYEYANLSSCTDPHCSGYGAHAEGTHVDANGNKVVVEELKNWTTVDELLDPTVIRYRFECNECGKTFQRYQQSGWSNAKHTSCPTSAGGCGSTHIRMVSSELQSCEIDENLYYYVYSTYVDKSYAPLDITAEVEMAYPVYVQSVVDGTEQYPFFNNGTKITGAKAYLEYSQDGTNWARMEASFNDSGLATFYVPMGTSYRIVGAHADEWAISRSTSNIIDGGFSLSKPYSVTGLDTQTMNGKRYIIGDGDYDNNGDIDDPGLKYYVHYYTVTANSGHGIGGVNVLSTTSQSKHDITSAKATYQRGATARVSAQISDGHLPVHIRLTIDNASYSGLNVYLSKSSTTLTDDPIKLTYNENTGRYEADKVWGSANGTTYYVWADGKNVSNVPTLEYTGVSVFVRPYIEPVKWSGNCKHDNHTQSYNPNQLCDASCSQSEVSHISLNSAPFTHSFTVYHTIVEQADAQDNVSKYDYRYADDHPTDPSNPNHDPKDPDNNPKDYPNDDKLDEYPENTVYYYTLEVTGDAGTKGASGSGVYLEGAVPDINTGIQSVRQNIGRTPIQVTLYLDGILWEGQTVTIGNKPATEIAPGVYKTVYNFASGTYAIKVTSPDTTLLDSGDVYGDTTVYGYITVTSTRTYTWKAWTDGHVTCSECSVKGACCDADGTPAQCNTNTLVYCTNCHIVRDSNQKEQSCCTTGDKKHTWTTCPYSGSVYSGNCLDNLTSAQTTKANSITIKHNSKLHGVTTHKDAFTFTGSNNIYFYTIHIDGDAGVDNVYIDGEKYEETVTIHNHGTTAKKSSVYHNDLPERLWTNTYHERTFFKEVVALYERRTDINVTSKAPVKNHAEAKTALAIKLTLNGSAYTGRSVTIGGYAATDSDNDGIYVTAYSGFVGGKTYPITVDGRAAGRIYLESYRSYRWLTWEEPWLDASGDWEREHECVYHDMMHQCGQALNCLDYYRDETGFYDNYNTIYSENFASLTARTEIIDEFHIYVDPNLNGGPDPYNPPSGDPDDPYKDPTDNDFYPGDDDIWGDPDTNPEEQPNPEYDPNHKPTDNPNYNPVNPNTPVDPSKDPDNFKPDDTTDGFYEEAPIPFYTLTVNTRLDNAATDDFPIKFENLTSGVTLYIIPDGQTYHVYDASGARLNNVPFIVSMADGKVVIALQDGDQYRISTLDEIEDRNNNDVIDINDIKTTTLQSYTYTTHTTGSIKKSAATVTIDFYTLTLDVYSDGVHKLPDFGKSVNGTTELFESPVWLDDVATSMDGAKNWWNETTDSNGDGDNYAVYDHHTVKVYLKGQAYDVDVKTADDNTTSRTQKPGTGYLVNHKNGTITDTTNIQVEYFSMTTDHYGGFTGTQINYGGKVHVGAATTAGATGNAVAKAFFLKDTQIEISASVATNNSWYQWTGTETYDNRTQSAIVMKQKRTESAWAKTSYTVRYYLHDKSEGWYQVAEDMFNSGNTVVINNRGWNSVTVTGEPSKYVNFDPFRTHSFSDPSAATPNILRDVLADGVVTTTIDVVVNANQVGGQSFVDFYFTRNGSKVDPTPNDPTIPDPVPTVPEAPTPTPQDPEDWDVDEKQEYVTITYVMNGGKYNGSSANYSETHLAGTDITLITPTPPAGKEFVGWFLTNLDGTTQSASGLIGTSKDHYLLCTDTVVYAVYVGQLDLGITANDIYGSIKTGSQFTSSATIVNHNNVSITPNTHINAVLTIMNGSTQVDRIVIKDIIVPGTSDPSKPGTQMISTVIDTTGWSASKTYTMTWSLDFSNSLYVDGDSSNNKSSLTSFKPNTYSGAVNTARPNYSTDRDPAYNKNTLVPGTSNTAFAWEYWTWNENSGYNGKFQKQTGSDQMNIVLILTPENESGLRTYTNGTFGLHNYTTRSGYGLSMHRVYNDLAGKYANGSNWAANKSHITLNSTVGKLEALMTFPEFNYSSTYQTSTGMTQQYAYINVSPAGSYYAMTMLPYTDYQTDDFNDQYAHYTPMWLPNGEYIPVTHISGMWTPIGELRATVQQGQYTSSTDMHKFGIYTNEVVIKGSLFDDLYNNP